MKTMELLPPNETMYRALVNRDPSFEGIFLVGVRTTGIFCRPTCPAKKPARENVEFFLSPNEALIGGYRPCLRCHPMDPVQPAPASAVATACPIPLPAPVIQATFPTRLVMRFRPCE